MFVFVIYMFKTLDKTWFFVSPANSSLVGKICDGTDISAFEILMKMQMLYLKGLGHAILGDFRTDQIVIELTKTSK